MAIFIYLIFIFFSSATACKKCVQSRASVYSSASALSSGACGYGSLAMKFNGGNIAAGVSSLYKDGSGCGACFQIRCKNSELCSKAGTKVILTDLNKSNATDFVVSSRAFRAMALPGKDLQVLKLGTMDVEYRRIPCDYKHQNLAIRVEESSRNPGYLMIKILYQGGQTEIVAIDVARWNPMPKVWGGEMYADFTPTSADREVVFKSVSTQVGSSNWTFMSRKFGAVWETSRAPNAVPLQFKFVITSGFDGKNIWAQNALPANWKPGGIYDTGIQLDDVALDGCMPCAGSWWN